MVLVKLSIHLQLEDLPRYYLYLVPCSLIKTFVGMTTVAAEETTTRAVVESTSNATIAAEDNTDILGEESVFY